MRKFNSIKRYTNLLFMKILDLFPMSGERRYRMAKYCGVRISKNGFIGRKVCFDTIRPDLIELEEGCYITEGCIIYTHYLIPDMFITRKGSWFRFGKVCVKKNAFLGARSIICNDVTIGENSIIGAGSVVTKDVPPNELWAGVPARFIKKIKN